ncbi:MAG: sulfate adenylyltransferase [Ignavibacteria bacterium]|nr:sulfate adenylyltransferase [Ignavibacteria bacterium]
MIIQPHGGTLVNRILKGSDRSSFLEKHKAARTIAVNDRTVSDIYMIAIGGFSPLNGFVTKKEYDAIVTSMHLTNGLVFSIPITLSVDKATFTETKQGETCALKDESGTVHAYVTVEDKFERDVRHEAKHVYRTEEEAHPGVQKVYEGGPYCIGGPIHYVNESPELEFPENNLTPAETRAEFERRGWNTVVAFQTRNPIHRAHEFLTKCALEIVDGLLIHPLVGETKSDDIPSDVRMACYKVLIDKYYVKDRVVLSVLPAAMRYAGPREAVFHAIMRKNYGCTHFIVGRDHAGVGNYYGTFDAQKIFDEIDLHAFGIEPLKFEHSFWCKVTGAMATEKTSPSTKEQRVFLSGTKVREMLQNKQIPPVEFSRPEVAEILIEWASKK